MRGISVPDTAVQGIIALETIVPEIIVPEIIVPEIGDIAHVESMNQATVLTARHTALDGRAVAVTAAAVPCSLQARDITKVVLTS